MNENQMKPVIWIGSSYEDWQTFPANVQDVWAMPCIWRNVARKQSMQNH